jgi:hypothetical protein
VADVSPNALRSAPKANRVGCRAWEALRPKPGLCLRPMLEILGGETRVGQVQVGPDLKLPGHDDIYVIGDAALALSRDGKKLPGLV